MASADPTGAATTDTASACRSCGAAVVSPWRYCAACGTATAADGRPRAREHHVTVAVSDLQGSTALAERLDPESLRLVFDRYFDEMGAALEAHGGRIEKRVGDAIITVFGLPAPAPDDAVRACRAVAETQAALANLNRRLLAQWGVTLTNRTGVGTGTVTILDAGGGHRVLSGPAFDEASALEPAAPAFEALLAPSTVAAIDDTVTVDPADTYTSKSGAGHLAHRLAAVATDDVSTTPPLPRCGACGSEVPRTDSGDVPAWCVECGTRLVVDTGHRLSRRTLTIVFADVRVASATDPEAARQAVVASFDAARAILERHGATVEKFIGDAVMAVFGLDRRHEDDSLRAVRAALEMQARLHDARRELDAVGVELEARIAVHTGPVIAGDPSKGQRLVNGDAVNVAARLEQTAAAGDVIVGPLTRRLCGDAIVVEDLPPLSLKGKSEPVPAARVLALAERVAVFTPLTPMYGRSAELERLRRELDRVVDQERCAWVAVEGDAGIGKSRLVHEFVDSLLGSALVLRGACLPYGDGITFWPLIEIVRSAAGFTSSDPRETALARLRDVARDDETHARLASLLGLVADQYPVAETFWAVRRLLEALAAERPVMAIVDGLHWAEPTLLDLLDHLHVQLADAPVLIITLARHEEGHSPHDRAGTEPDVITLGPLDDDDIGRLLVARLGGEVLTSVRAPIVAAADGNPLFADQLVTMLQENERLELGPRGWGLAAGTEQLDVPPTVEAVLAARVDALDRAEREAIDPASVIGRDFGRRAVASLAGEPPDSIDAAITELTNRQLVVAAREPDELADHRFISQLLRDVVYSGLLKQIRSDLHGRLARWIETTLADRAGEVEEILGYHFEQAARLRAEIGLVDDETSSLGGSACTRLSSAGERAFTRGDMHAAANLLTRAAAIVPGADTRRPPLLLRSAEAQIETGRFREAVESLDRARTEASEAGDRRTAARAELARCMLGFVTGDGVDSTLAKETAERLRSEFVALGDAAGEARSWRLRSQVELTHCRYGAAADAAMAAIEAARRAGDAVLEQRMLPALPSLATLGPRPVREVITQAREVLGAVRTRRGRALVERSLGRLLALDGHVEEGRAMCAATRDVLVELGWNFEAGLISMDLGALELSVGRPDLAEVQLQAGYERLEELGERNYIATMAVLLAEAVRQLGRLDEALEHARFAEEVAAGDDVVTQVAWRSVRARVLGARGELDEARRLVDEALALALDTDDIAQQGDTFSAGAEVAAASGDRDRADRHAHEALNRYRAKGRAFDAARSEAFLASLARTG